MLEPSFQMQVFILRCFLFLEIATETNGLKSSFAFRFKNPAIRSSIEVKNLQKNRHPKQKLQKSGPEKKIEETCIMLGRRQTTANSCSLLGIQHEADRALLSNRPEIPSMSSVGIGQQVHFSKVLLGVPGFPQRT